MSEQKRRAKREERGGKPKPKAKAKNHPTLGMPKDVGEFLVDCLSELQNAVEKHPYFADVFVHKTSGLSHAYQELAGHREDLVQGIARGEVSAGDVVNVAAAEAWLAWHEGNRAAFSKHMKQTIAVLIRSWQLGLKTMKKGGAK